MSSNALLVQHGMVKGGPWRGTAMPGKSTAGPGRVRCGPVPSPIVHGRAERRRRSTEQRCCVPSGCSRYAGAELIDPDEPGDAVKVVCSNPSCVAGSWMHADCYDDWQQRVLFYIRWRITITTKAASNTESMRCGLLRLMTCYFFIFKPLGLAIRAPQMTVRLW